MTSKRTLRPRILRAFALFLTVSTFLIASALAQQPNAGQVVAVTKSQARELDSIELNSANPLFLPAVAYD